MAWWGAVALAAPFGGFRVPDVRPDTSAYVRQVVVPGRYPVLQTTARARLQLGQRLSIDAEGPLVLVPGEPWSAYSGLLRASVRGWLETRGGYHAIGLEGGIPVRAAEDRPPAWGGVSREVGAAGDVLLTWESALRVDHARYFHRMLFGGMLDAPLRGPVPPSGWRYVFEFVPGFAQPVGGPLWLVVEGELALVDQPVLSLRGLLGVEGVRWRVHAGVQLSSFVHAPAVIAQVGGRFP